MEVLRSSFTAGGERVYLLFQPTTRRFRLATRWCYVASFLQLQDATDAFEALELSDRPAAQLGRLPFCSELLQGADQRRMGRLAMPQPIAVIDPDAPGTLRLGACQTGLDGLEINGRIDWQGATAPVLERVFHAWNPDWKKGSVSARYYSLGW